MKHRGPGVSLDKLRPALILYRIERVNLHGNAKNPKNNRATPSEPGDSLAGSCKPRASAPELVNQVDIEPIPQPLGRDAPIVPVDGHDPAEPMRILDDRPDQLPGLNSRKVEMGREKQCGVHHMQRQFEQAGRLERFKRLRCSCAIPDGFVVAHRGIVGEPCLFQSQRRVVIKIEPMHANPEALDARYPCDLIQLFTSFRALEPRVDSMEPYLTPRRYKSPEVIRDVASSVA